MKERESVGVCERERKRVGERERERERDRNRERAAAASTMWDLSSDRKKEKEGPLLCF